MPEEMFRSCKVGSKISNKCPMPQINAVKEPLQDPRSGTKPMKEEAKEIEKKTCN